VDVESISDLVDATIDQLARQHRPGTEERAKRAVTTARRRQRRHRMSSAVGFVMTSAAVVGAGIFVSGALGPLGADEPRRSSPAGPDGGTPAASNGDIVFVCEPSGHEGVYTIALCGISPDGTGRFELTAPGTVDVEPEWSPDGTRVAFTRSQLNDEGVETGSVIMLVDEAGQEREIPLGSGYHYSPTWAPDGATIAYVESPGRIYTVRLDGSQRMQLTDEPEYADLSELDPSWSPDGSMIAYTHIEYDPKTESHLQSVYLINSDGTGAHALTDPELMASEPNWSPDRTQITFTSERGQYGDVYVIDVDGTGLRRLTEDVSPSGGAVWSPDGTKIAFSGVRGGTAGLYILDLDSGAISLVTEDGGGDPTWQPLIEPEVVQ